MAKSISDSDSSHSASAGLVYWLPSLSSNSDSSSSVQADVPRPLFLTQCNNAHHGRHSSAPPAASRQAASSSSDVALPPAFRSHTTDTAARITSDGSQTLQSPSVTMQMVYTGPLGADHANGIQQHMPMVETDFHHDVMCLDRVGPVPQGRPQAGDNVELPDNQGPMGPGDDESEIASLGSAKHSTGECSPCIFWFKHQCAKGAQCRYCHLAHKGQKNKRIRPSKRTRNLRREGGDEDGLTNIDEDNGGADGPMMCL